MRTLLFTLLTACGTNQPDVVSKVCLTFDDTLTHSILDKVQGIPVTFFPVSRDLAHDVRDRALAEGHQIGNHTSNSPNLATLTLEQQLAEVQLADQELGLNTRYLRPPYGERNADTYALGKTVVMWSRNVDVEDPAPGVMLLHREERISYVIQYAKDNGLTFAPLEDCL